MLLTNLFMNYKNFFDITLREANLDRINKFSNLNDEQKEEIREFYKKNTTGYNDFIDWQHPDKVTYDDFLKAKQAKENSKSQLRKKRGEKIRSAYDDVMKFFDRDDFIYQGENDDWVFVSPLSWEACKYADSIDCGGGKAGWCIGWEKEPRYWNTYVGAGNAFILAFNKHFKDVENKDDGIKYMIRFNDTGYYSDLLYGRVVGDIWNQLDDSILEFCCGDEYTENIVDITIDELVKYSEVFWKKLEELRPDFSPVCQRECHNALEFDDILDDDRQEYYLDKMKEDVINRLGHTEDELTYTQVEYIEGECVDSLYEFEIYNPWDYLANTCPTVFDVRRKYNDRFFLDNDTYNETLERMCKYIEDNLFSNHITDLPYPKEHISIENTVPIINPLDKKILFYKEFQDKLTIDSEKNIVFLLDYSDYEQIKDAGYTINFRFCLSNTPNIFTNEDIKDEEKEYLWGIANSYIDNMELDINRDERLHFVSCKIVEATLNVNNHIMMYETSIENLNNSKVKGIQVYTDSAILNSQNSECNQFATISKYDISPNLKITDSICLVSDGIKQLYKLNTSNVQDIRLRLDFNTPSISVNINENGNVVPQTVLDNETLEKIKSLYL